MTPCYCCKKNLQERKAFLGRKVSWEQEGEGTPNLGTEGTNKEERETEAEKPKQEGIRQESPVAHRRIV
jgi:hypothetical protein